MNPAKGYTSLTVSGTAVGVSSASPSFPIGVQRCLIRCTGADVRIRDDGTNPTASVGFPLLDGDTLWFDGDIYRLKAIRTGATDAVLDILCY